jgi:hypothetical protein
MHSQKFKKWAFLPKNWIKRPYKWRNSIKNLDLQCNKFVVRLKNCYTEGTGLFVTKKIRPVKIVTGITGKIQIIFWLKCIKMNSIHEETRKNPGISQSNLAALLNDFWVKPRTGRN